MKICYDMLEGMYLTAKGNMKKGNHIYYINPNVCKTCGEEFLSCIGRVSEYCSRRCNAKTTLVGRVMSDEGRRKLSECNSGKRSHMYGKIGPLSPTYKHDKTDEEREVGRNYNAYYEWRKQVYKRDDYTCQCCGERGGNLNAHHVESYCDNVEIRTELSNGVSLCKTCHKDFHHQYGNGRNNKTQFKEFINKENDNG